MARAYANPTGTADQARPRPGVSSRAGIVLLAIPVVAIAVLVYLSTDDTVVTLVIVGLMVASLLAGWALTARDASRRRRGGVSALDEARSALDLERVHAARVEHGESAGITEIRRQLPSLTYEQAVEIHRYV